MCLLSIMSISPARAMYFAQITPPVNRGILQRKIS